MIDKLKKWLKGDADSKAEQWLDKSAQKDDFLAEAMEGYRSVPEGEHSKSIEELKATLQKRYKKDKKGIAWKSIAAAAVILMSVGLLYLVQEDNRRGPIVDSHKPPIPSEIQKSNTKVVEKETATGILEKESDFNNNEITLAEKPRKQTYYDNTQLNQAGIESTDTSVGNSALETIDSSPQLNDELIAEVTSSMPPKKSDTNASTFVEPSKSLAITVDSTPLNFADAIITEPSFSDEVKEIESDDLAAPKSKLEKKENTLNGIVTGPNGEAIIGANILLQGTITGANSDHDGKFTLKSTQTLPWELVVSYIGYETQSIMVSDFEEQVVIAIKEAQIASNEVHVSASKIRSKKQERASAASSTSRRPSKDSYPKPKNGFKKFKRYIKKNLKYPKAAIENNVEGIVKLRFYINAEGNPEDITVQTSLGFGCDEEAIRLIREGVGWKPVGIYGTYELIFNM